MSLWSLVFWVEVIDYISLILEVEGIVYGCYVKNGRVQNVSLPHITNSFPNTQKSFMAS
jgi:hypothetical protein